MHKLWEFEGYFQDTFQVEAGFTKQDNGYRLQFQLTGPLEQLVIPGKAATAGFRHELWKHTCFEAFLQDAKSQAYWEFNFSPSREWAIYRFANYREPIEADLSPFDLVIHQERYPGTLLMKIDIKSKIPMTASRAGLTAVLEHQSEARSYWALRHTGDKPDFHAADSFIHNI